MRLVTDTIIFAIAMASMVAAAVPQQFWSRGLEKRESDETCPTWWIEYIVLDDSGNKYVEGYFEVDDCYNYDEYKTFGDGTFTLGVTRENYTAVLTEYSTGLTITGFMYPDNPGPDDDGGETTCWTGGGPKIPNLRFPFCYWGMAHGSSKD